MEWKEVKIGDLGQIITGKTPKTAIRENWGGKIPFLSPSDDMSNKTSPVTARTLTELGVAEVAKCLIPANSICVSCIGSDLGKVVKTDRELVTNQQINTIVPHSNIDSDFVYYLMCIVGKELNYISKTSTAVPIINKSTFSDWDIVIPREKEDQRRIASILSSLDQKIELNNKINADLEETAQAIFKNWFVDFEPFKDGKFVDSELGMIPEGWKVGTLEDIAEITMGQSPAGNSLNENGEGMIFYQGSSDFGFRFPSIRVFTTEPKRLAVANSVLFSVRAPVGDINVAKEECCIGRGVASIKSKYGHDSYLFYAMKSLHKLFDSFDGEGTVFGSINKKTLSAIQILLPSDGIVEQFNNVASSFDDRIRSLSDENSRLSTLRDTLLPRLMSGELEVPD